MQSCMAARFLSRILKECSVNSTKAKTVVYLYKSFLILHDSQTSSGLPWFILKMKIWICMSFACKQSSFDSVFPSEASPSPLQHVHHVSSNYWSWIAPWISNHMIRLLISFMLRNWCLIWNMSVSLYLLFFYFFILFIYFLAALGIPCCTWAFL